jgi:hypothetical protein
MAIRLSFDIIGSTCGDLLRFADAVRAAGTHPEIPLQQAGPNRIDVVVNDKSGAGPAYRPVASHPSMDGASIEIRRDSVSHGAQATIDTVDRWRVALTAALESAVLDDATRAALLHLRGLFSDERPSPGHPGGS